MASTALLAADYAALAREAGRRHSDVRDVSPRDSLLVFRRAPRDLETHVGNVGSTVTTSSRLPTPRINFSSRAVSSPCLNCTQVRDAPRLFSPARPSV